VRTGDRVSLTAKGVALGEVTADDVGVADLNGEVVAGSPTSELELHLAIVWTTNAVALLLGFGMYASFILLPEYVETPERAGYGFGASVTGAGLFLLPSTLAMLVAGAQTGRLERRFGSKPPLLAGALVTAASYALLAVSRSERWEIYLAALLLGVGIGLAFAAMVNLIIENVGPEQTGVATGINTLARSVGGAFGGAIVASILAGSVDAGGFPSVAGFTAAFAACAIALALGVLVGLAIPKRARR
jgi:MFS family permease